MSRRRTREDVGTKAPTVRRKPPVVVGKPKVTKPKVEKKPTKERKTSKQRREERAAAQKAAERAAERAAAQKAAQERLMREASKVTQKRDELKEVRTKQAAISTEVHLLERKGEAIQDLDISTTAGANRAIQMTERYNEMAGGVIDHAGQIRDKIQSDYDKAKVAKSSVVANRKDYTTESYEEFLDDFSTFERESLDTIENYDKFIESVEDAKEVGTSNITKVKDWKSKRGELSRELQLARQQRQKQISGARVGIPGKTTVTWTEGGVEKQAVFDKPEQAEAFVKRRKKRGQLAEIRVTGAPTVKVRTGPLANIMTKLDLNKKKLFEQSGLSKEMFPARYKGYDLTPEQLKSRIGWLGSVAAMQAIRTAPVIVAGVAGAIVGGPLGAVFVPAVLGGFTLPSVTTFEQKEQFKQYMKDHPEAYTEMIVQGMVSLGMAWGAGKLYNRFAGPKTKQVTMTSEEYLQYLKDNPEVGGRAGELIHEPPPEHMDPDWLIALKKIVPQSVKDAWRRIDIVRSARRGRLPRAVGGPGQPIPLEDIDWEFWGYEPDKVHPVIDVSNPVLLGGLPIWALAYKIGGPGIYDVIMEHLQNMGISEDEARLMIPSMDDLSKLADIDMTFPSFDSFKDLVNHFAQDPGLANLMKVGADLQDFQEPINLSDQFSTLEQIHEQIDEIPEPTPEPTPIPPIPDLELPPLLEPALLRPKILRDKKRKPRETGRRGRPRDMGARLPTKRIRYSPKPEPYQVDFAYTGGKGETHLVEARSFPEAHSKAYKMKRIEEKPTLTEIERILHGEPLHEELLIEESLFGESNPGNPKNKTKKLKKKPKRKRRPGPPPGTKPGLPPGKKKTTPKTRTSGGKERHKKEAEDARRKRKPRRRSRVVGR